MAQLAIRSDLEGKGGAKLLGEITTSWPPPWLRSSYSTTDRNRVWPELVLGMPFGLGKDLQDRWPEVMMTHADCSACHHELQTPSWRQVRGYLGKPGRPPAKAWPMVLAHLETVSGAESKSFPEARQTLVAALDQQPFGQPEAVFAATSALAGWAGKLAQNPHEGFTRDQAQGLLHSLVSLPADDYPDFDSARQLAWAFEAIYDEWFPEKGSKHAHDAEIRKNLADLEQHLNLRAYSSSQKERQQLVAAAIGKKGLSGAELQDAVYAMKSENLREALLRKDFLQEMQKLSDKGLAQTLDRAASYDPREFKKQLEELSRLLK
jgi:hypothetical protein